VKKEEERDIEKFTLTLFCYMVNDHCAIIFIFMVSFHFVGFYHKKKKHGCGGGFIITYLKHCCENYDKDFLFILYCELYYVFSTFQNINL